MRLKDTACASTQRRIQRKAANSYGSELREARLRGPGQQVRLGSGINSKPAGSAGLGASLLWAPRLRLLTTAVMLLNRPVKYHTQYNHSNFLIVVRRPKTAVPVQVHINRNACQNMTW